MRRDAEREHALSFGGVRVERDDLEAVGRGGAAGAARRVAQHDLAVGAWPHAAAARGSGSAARRARSAGARTFAEQPARAQLGELRLPGGGLAAALRRRDAAVDHAGGCFARADQVAAQGAGAIAG